MFNIDKYRNSDGYSIDISSINDFLTDDNTKVMYIPLRYQYRPDLIAYSLYGDVSYSTFLAVINGFKNTPEDFSVNTLIKYLDPAYKDLL